MHRTPLFAATLSMLIVLLVVSVLALGFGVDMAQAISQSMPILLITGLIAGLSTALLERELA